MLNISFISEKTLQNVFHMNVFTFCNFFLFYFFIAILSEREKKAHTLEVEGKEHNSLFFCCKLTHI